jgi:hypothetical protein
MPPYAPPPVGPSALSSRPEDSSTKAMESRWWSSSERVEKARRRNCGEADGDLGDWGWPMSWSSSESCSEWESSARLAREGVVGSGMAMTVRQRSRSIGLWDGNCGYGHGDVGGCKGAGRLRAAMGFFGGLACPGARKWILAAKGPMESKTASEGVEGLKPGGCPSKQGGSHMFVLGRHATKSSTDQSAPSPIHHTQKSRHFSAKPSHL